jgi:hypothetical protein
MSMKTLYACITAIVTMSALACGGGGGGVDLSSPTAPANPKNTDFSGTWVGTMSRPSGLPSIGVRWTATQNPPTVSGPLTLTANGVTVDAILGGAFSGGQSNESALGPMLITRPAAPAVLPACQIVIEQLIFKGFTPTSTTLTSGTVSVRYGNCNGLVDNDAGLTFHNETTQVTLNKQ